MGKVYQVTVIGFKSEKMVIDLCNTEEQMKSLTVLQFKEKIAQRMPSGDFGDNMRLVFADKMLDGNEKQLSSYGIQHQSVIHMVITVPGGLRV